MARDLFDAAFAAMQKCHAPYSKFPVGAALRTKDGRIYSGCNIEVISFPEGWCAETTMLSHYVMGGGGEIAEILVMAEKLEKCSPCGGCRQRLAEFAGADVPLHLCDHSGIVQTVTMRELLPFSFQTDVIG
ncbi:cytidine deaminase [Pseudochrobactrum sp. HB0163]|uniref:cytidine deaminase n=1 Tax=Pseudochrobactrum sp. HB0163 TaxID=3450708 RepID=UPI003F6E12E1